MGALDKCHVESSVLSWSSVNTKDEFRLGLKKEKSMKKIQHLSWYERMHNRRNDSTFPSKYFLFPNPICHSQQSHWAGESSAILCLEGYIFGMTGNKKNIGCSLTAFPCSGGSQFLKIFFKIMIIIIYFLFVLTGFFLQHLRKHNYLWYVGCSLILIEILQWIRRS